MRRPRSPRTVVVWLSVYLLVAANWALWLQLIKLGEVPAVYWRSIGAVALLVLAANLALLSVTAWSRGWVKWLWVALLLVAGLVQHYMLAYSVVMDPTMLANTVQTDWQETRDLLGWRLAFMMLVVTLPAALPMARIRLARFTWWGQLWRNALLFLVALVLAGVALLTSSRELAPLMRNNPQLRYMMNPVSSVYSMALVKLRPLFTRPRRLIAITAGSTLGASYAAQIKPPLLLLVVGETARADHFALNGYGRDTTPELARRRVLSWRNVRSCGTNTLASVPCMFSPLGKQAFESRDDDYENLLDVAQAAGLAVLWIENQAGGCKGVCARVPTQLAWDGLTPALKSELCEGDECLDDVLLQNLDQRLAALPAERRARGVLLVMHQMGSHGPAYYKRSPPAAKVFRPECGTNVLADCTQDQLINAYDNSIVYTDRFLGLAIDWLKDRSTDFDTGLLYLSDHGESLGEFGLFLHGLPYSMAPDVQKHVPMVAWFLGGIAERRRLSLECLGRTLDAPLTHDNLYHEVLGLLDVKTPTYKPELDAFASCRDGN
ncbi:MAG: sulfatase-like hydrolase/transferase [Variovorax sp.]